MNKRNFLKKSVFFSPNEKKTFGKELNFGAAEAYRLLRTNLLFALPFSSLPEGETCRIVGITSSLSGEGKSTTALNLAYVLAESGRKVLLMETDLRLPTICKRLGLEVKYGLSNFLAGFCKEEEILLPSGIQERLLVIGAGITPPNPSEMLGSSQMKDLLKRLSSSFDFIILDLPPVNEVSDALVASRLAHGIVMVVRQDYATRSSVAEAMRQMDHINAKVLGFIVTHSNIQSGRYKSYHRGKYSYGYAAAAKKGSES